MDDNGQKCIISLPFGTFENIFNHCEHWITSVLQWTLFDITQNVAFECPKDQGRNRCCCQAMSDSETPK